MYTEWLNVVKISNKNFFKIMENSIKFGNQILIENIGE